MSHCARKTHSTAKVVDRGQGTGDRGSLECRDAKVGKGRGLGAAGVLPVPMYSGRVGTSHANV